MKEKLLTRDEFREGCFARDNHKCIICGAPAKDAHHILERRLYGPSCGYFRSNSASLCNDCHLKAEMTLISVEDIRVKLNITNPTLPDHFYDDVNYDKWGNIILENGRRCRGELFHDESVQKILKEGGVLDLYTKYVKYPRTYHLPWSPGKTKDDRVLENCKQFEDKEIIVTCKLDGENCTLLNDHIHARSIDSKNHVSRNWCKNFWSQIKNDIPDGYRICGENMYAVHSIEYNDLESYFYGFSVWNEKNICLSWKETLEWFELLGIIHPKILYQGIWNEKLIKNLYDEKQRDKMEGYVVRLADSFSYGQFRHSVAKYVRSQHITSENHWFYGREIKANKLKENNENIRIIKKNQNF